MPRKRNLRMETYNKLINIGKSTEKDISNLKIEDLKEITKDPDVLNIIALREFIKEHNTIGYFNYQQQSWIIYINAAIVAIITFWAGTRYFKEGGIQWRININ